MDRPGLYRIRPDADLQTLLHLRHSRDGLVRRLFRNALHPLPRGRSSAGADRIRGSRLPRPRQKTIPPQRRRLRQDRFARRHRRHRGLQGAQEPARHRLLTRSDHVHRHRPSRLHDALPLGRPFLRLYPVRVARAEEQLTLPSRFVKLQSAAGKRSWVKKDILKGTRLKKHLQTAAPQGIRRFRVSPIGYQQGLFPSDSAAKRAKQESGPSLG
ncbi:hypothetical protein TRIP_B330540 [uncultured Desulfatiglans sp.]|uniref:Uncharacterized protein n=1 Tax=Uncultured Desulfatiglans sp. TaxID=1748965 RepID=A0A653A8Y7_UNCDX|nr:hypothetical protein TRIP_B330540 [uncultured Desulfatiglans sp.]